MQKKILSLFVALGTLVAFGSDVSLDAWRDTLHGSRPKVPARSTRSPMTLSMSAVLTAKNGGGAYDAAKSVASKVFGDEVMRTISWQTAFSSDEERLDVGTFATPDGLQNSFAVYGQLGNFVPYYWTVSGLAGGQDVPSLLADAGLMGGRSAAYMVDGLLSAADTVMLDKGAPVAIPFERFYFAFVDDVPRANWEHPCRYVFVSEDATSFAVLYKMMPPRLRSRATSEAIRLSPIAEAQGECHNHAESLDAVTGKVYAYANSLVPNILSYSTGDKSKSYFVLISGGIDPENNGIRFWSDTAMMYSTLTKKYGVSKDNIFVYISDGTSSGKDANLSGWNSPVLVDSPRDLDGDGSSDVDGAASSSVISGAFAALRSSLTANDQLWVFITSHGGPDGEQGPNNHDCTASLFSSDGSDQFTDDQLASWTSGFKCPVAFLIETCFSGGFVDDISKTANRVIATACNHNEYSWGITPSDVTTVWDNVGYTRAYNTFSAPFIAAIRGWKPASYSNYGYPWSDGNSVSSDANGDGLVSFSEANDYACANDSQICKKSSHPDWCSYEYDDWGNYGSTKEHPQYASNPSTLGSSFYVLKQNGGGTTPVPESHYGLDCATVSLATGTPPWYEQTSVSYYGGSAACSGVVGDNESSYLQTTVTGPCTVSFYWKVSSEQNWDILSFYVDDESMGNISGEVDWTQKSVSIGSGTHTIRWRYVKDGGWKSGSDCGWVDKLVVTPSGGGSRIWTVKYHKNTPGGADETKSQNFVVNQAQRLLYLDSALKWSCKDSDGFSYTFLGWAKSQTGSPVYSNGQSVTDLVAAGKVLHLYAVWQKKAYNVVYHSNDGRNLKSTQEFRPKIAKTLLWLSSGLRWTRSGYDFLGWAKSPSGGAIYKNGQNVVDLVDVGETLHLYAKWQDRSATYTVRFHKNDGTSTVADQVFKVIDTKSLTWVESGLGWSVKVGSYKCAFIGWALSPTGGIVYKNGEKVHGLAAAGSTLHLYAAWQIYLANGRVVNVVNGRIVQDGGRELSCQEYP